MVSRSFDQNIAETNSTVNEEAQIATMASSAYDRTSTAGLRYGSCDPSKLRVGSLM